MNRLVGIIGAIVLLIANAAWALERCQSLNAHHDGHEHRDRVAHAHNHELGIHREQSSPEEPVIHCVNSGESPSFIVPPSPRMARLVITQKISSSFVVPVTAQATGWLAYSEKRPPGSFLAAVSPYLSLSVLRV